MKTSIITDMQASGQVVHTIPTRDAEPLLTAGLVRRASIDPAPPRGKTAVNLTGLGRGFGGSAPEPADDTPEAE